MRRPSALFWSPSVWVGLATRISRNALSCRTSNNGSIPLKEEILEKHAPERVKLSNGKTPKLTYSREAPPYLALRIQELYDVTQLPIIAMHKAGVTAHILAPNMRPVQITQDMAGFWKTTIQTSSASYSDAIQNMPGVEGVNAPGILTSSCLSD